ncbi:membrane fusion protein, multidrug efflux system [Flavobacterium aquidurense]|uniref:Efflux transporter periplasmic adaptor subunit n=1 Tax=Flavobacterium frigidimaris TaxID=262320 RepID=A0ABX4BQQ1_FLAFR|nr:efflux RND transporter periplasmic adaptor subunit [Flavobacterium frigidimaris]OXA79395.1 efflux transporter periplasmic adaptor subunit [Flavobacterium frigidimaris]SDZ33517.1 membrane fusion protein, multidrug efflux system [Flavobacterium aquidurense]
MNRIYSPTIFLLFLLLSCKKETPPAPKPLEIPIVQVLQQDVNLESEFTGQTFGESDIQINPRVDGVILSLNFKEGGLVKKGQLLYTIDPLPFQTKVNEAEGQLAEMQARLAKTKSDYEMMVPLAKINAISQRELIAARSSYNASQASIKAASANLKNSKIELGYSNIVSPISGLIGISKVRVGDYVRPGPASVLNTVSDLGDVRVRFTVSEQEFLRIFREISKKDSNLKNAAKTISILLSDGSIYSEKGKISFADRQIDPATGAVTFEAAFANPQQLIRPGQYVKVIVTSDIRKNALIIPQRSVIEMQGITQVYVLGKDNKVEMKAIQLGPAFKDSYIVTDGLTANDKIALGGTSQLKSGNVITPKIQEWTPGQGQAVK